MTAIQAIRSITNWLYWQSPTSETFRGLTHIARKSPMPNINKIREAANTLKQARDNSKTTHQNLSAYEGLEEYWTPPNLALPSTAQTKSHSEPKSSEYSSKEKKKPNLEEQEYRVRENRERHNPMRARVPTGMAVIGAVIIRLQEGGGTAGGGLEEHIGGSLALEMVNSSWLHVILAGIPWYFIGMVLVGLVEAIQKKR